MVNLKINITFEHYKIIREQFMEIGQFLGFLVFMGIFSMGFWLMIFLLAFVVPYWLVGNIKEIFKFKREAKKA